MRGFFIIKDALLHCFETRFCWRRAFARLYALRTETRPSNLWWVGRGLLRQAQHKLLTPPDEGI